MPRYEIIAHVTRELPCESAGDAAARFREHLLAGSGAEDALLHLAVWREDAAPAASPLPSTLRAKLVDFFSTLERCAGEAESAFRERVAAILSDSPGGSPEAAAPGRQLLRQQTPAEDNS
jgi:hypothetical protein